MNDNINPIYASPTKIALLFGLNIGTLANLRSKNEGPPYTKLGKKVLYEIEDVKSWLQNNNEMKIKASWGKL